MILMQSIREALLHPASNVIIYELCRQFRTYRWRSTMMSWRRQLAHREVYWCAIVWRIYNPLRYAVPMNWNQKNFVSLLPVLTTFFLNATWVLAWKLECPDNIVSICWTGKEPWTRRSFHNRTSCLMKYLGRGRFELRSSSLKVWVLTKWEEKNRILQDREEHG